MEHKKRIFPRLFGRNRPRRKKIQESEAVQTSYVPDPPQAPIQEEPQPVWDTALLHRPELSNVRIPGPNQENTYRPADLGTVQQAADSDIAGPQPDTALASRPSPINTTSLEPSDKESHLDEIVDTLLRDKDFLLAKELSHKADEFNALLMQAQKQGLKVEIDTTKIEPKPGKSLSWLEVHVYKKL